VSKRIAPDLEAFVDAWIHRVPLGQLHRAKNQVKALLAAARAAMKAGPYVSDSDDFAMGRALARLDRVSEGGKR